ncbi:hypothetical protein D3C78_1375920 [compost metagenome]
MAAPFGQVVGLGLDDPRAQPQPVDPVADHLAEQFAGDQAGVAVEEGVRQWPGAGPGQAGWGDGGRHGGN